MILMFKMLLVITIVIIILSVYIYFRITRQKKYLPLHFFSSKDITKYKLESFFNNSYHYNQEEVVISKKYKIKLHIFSPRKNNSEKYFIYHHGIKTGFWSGLKYFYIFLNKNYTCISYDSRGWGNNIDTKCTYGTLEKDDLYSVISYLRSSRTITKMILMGESMGGLTVLEYIKKYSTDGIDKIIIDGGVTNLFLTISNEIKKTTKYFSRLLTVISFIFIYVIDKWNPFKLKPYKDIHKFLNKPTLIIHSKTDQLVDYKNTLLLRQKCKKNKKVKFEIYDEAEHVLEIKADYKRYWKTITKFIDS